MKRKVKYYRMKDIGKKGGHYLEIAVMTGKGPKGGKTIGKIITKNMLQKRARRMARKRWA